jgi:hypothetical protein
MVIIDIDSWADTTQKAFADDVRSAKAEMTELLVTILASVNSKDSTALRAAIDSFEAIEMDISGDVSLLSCIYTRLPFYEEDSDTDDERVRCSVDEAKDEELMAAAREAFGP